MAATVELPPAFEVALEDAKDDPERTFRILGVLNNYKAAVDVALELEDTPRTRDELWDAVYKLTGYAIPRTAVCIEHNHVAPFTTFADLYFGETEEGVPVNDVLWIGNRGGGKTTNSGFLHGAKDRWNPGYSTCIVGATEDQAKRGYSEFQRFCKKIEDEIIDTLMKKTLFINGSQHEAITGTLKGVNGPHPHLAQFDELELVTHPQIYQDWINMSQGDSQYPGQNLLTSTRKFPYGQVQQIVEEGEEAIRNGDEPAYRVDIFCVWETVQNQPGCGKTCGCETVVKGKFVDPVTGAERARTLKEVCGGRAKRATGFVPLADVKRRFRSLGRRTWAAQQECLRPGAEGVVHAWLDDHHILPVWYPRAEYGPIYRSWDWGGTNPHSVHFSQLLKVPIKLVANTPQGRYEKLMQPGMLITFDEVYHPGGGYGALGLEVMERTAKWQRYGFEMEIAQDVCDPAGASAKIDVTNKAKENGFPEPQWKTYPVPRDDSLEIHIEWGEDDNLYVVGSHCPKLLWEYSRYHWPEQKPDKPPPKFPVEVDDHAMDEQRYLIWYLYKQGHHSRSHEAPSSEYQKTRQHPMSRENESFKSGKNYGEQVGGSTASPDYAGAAPYTEAPTVRRSGISVRRG